MNTGRATALDWVPAPAPLAHGRQWSSVQRMASKLGDIAASYYVECRTAEDSNRIDLLVSVSRGRRQALQSWLASQRSAPEALCRLSAAWNDSGGAFADVSALWLEYDHVERDVDATSPCVSVCLVPNYDERASVDGAWTHGACVAPLSSVTEVIVGHRMPTETRDKLARCLEALPANARVIHVSAMLGRPGAPLKLYCVVPRRLVGQFLKTAGWCGPTSVMSELVDGYCTQARVGDEVYCDVTVSDIDRIGGNVFGVVFAPQHLLRASESQPGRDPLLEECVRAGLCSREQRDELVRWPDRGLVEVEWYGERASVVMERWLDVKLVWAPGKGTSLKAYLGLSGRGANAFDRSHARMDAP